VCEIIEWQEMDHFICWQELKGLLKRYQKTIEIWARERGVWGDAFWRPYNQMIEWRPYVDGPRIAELCFDGSPLYDVINDGTGDFESLSAEWANLAYNNPDFDWDSGDGPGLCSLVLYAKDPLVAGEYGKIMSFDWVHGLMNPIYLDACADIYEHFARYQDHLRIVDETKFRNLVDGVFRNNGFRTVAYPGPDTDIFLFQHDIVGEMVTLLRREKIVTRPIIETIHDLDSELSKSRARAHRGLYVTTSGLTKADQAFAGRLKRYRVRVADTDEIQEWCEDVSKKLKTLNFDGSLHPLTGSPILSSADIAEMDVPVHLPSH
jgi:hypothetical protein